MSRTALLFCTALVACRAGKATLSNGSNGTASGDDTANVTPDDTATDTSVTHDDTGTHDSGDTGTHDSGDTGDIGDTAGTYTGTITAAVTVGYTYACAGPATVEIAPDGTVLGTASCEASPAPYTVSGDLDGKVTGHSYTGTWHVTISYNRVDIPLTGTVSEGTFTATFSYSGSWYEIDGEIDATK